MKKKKRNHWGEMPREIAVSPPLKPWGGEGGHEMALQKPENASKARL